LAQLVDTHCKHLKKLDAIALACDVNPNIKRLFPQDAQRADKKEIAGRRRKERPL